MNQRIRGDKTGYMAHSWGGNWAEDGGADLRREEEGGEQPVYVERNSLGRCAAAAAFRAEAGAAGATG